MQVVGATLPEVIRKRQQRKAAYVVSSKEASQWMPLVQANRHAPTLLLTNDKDLPQARLHLLHLHGRGLRTRDYIHVQWRMARCVHACVIQRNESAVLDTLHYPKHLSSREPPCALCWKIPTFLHNGICMRDMHAGGDSIGLGGQAHARE